jgi:TetR/AcrR family transcriptional regulator, transcriptional repressor for nem operon
LQGVKLPRSDQKEQTRQRILEAAGRGFRKGGFAGVGVDGLAKEAGVTSGAFYVHFGSKASAFEEVLAVGLAKLRGTIERVQSEHGKKWWPVFVHHYLGPRRTCDLADSCALQSLASEVARSGEAARVLFEAELRQIAAVIVAGPTAKGTPKTQDDAMAALAMLIGAVTLSRGVSDAKLGAGIAGAVEGVLLFGSR